MLNVKIGGVPEHFNYPWYVTLKNKEYQKKNINLRWQDFPGGTGSMNAALRNGEIDLAVILAEGIIKDIIDGNPSKIVQEFVNSPLVWGIHVSNSSSYHDLKDLRGTKAAISRLGSGSHLMAYLNAQDQEWDIDNDLHFEVINDLDGAIEGLTNGTADYFMWEKFTTKPLVDSKVFRRIGEIPTPWPCFVIAATDDFIKNHAAELHSILKIINAQTKDFKSMENLDAIISERYEQKIEDVREWLNITEWSQTNMSYKDCKEIQMTLSKLGIIDQQVDPKQLLYNS